MEFVIVMLLVIAFVLFIAYKLGDDSSKENVASAVVVGAIVFCVFLFFVLLSSLK